MGKINLVRVDDRLIHGQVMTKWSKGLGTNAIYVVDDGVAADDFMKTIYINTNSSAGLTIKVYSVDEAVQEWQKDEYGNDNAILLFKNIASVKRAMDGGLPVEQINIGGIAKTADAVFIINSVGLSKANGAILKELEEKGHEVYFQTVPDTKKVSLAEALQKL